MTAPAIYGTGVYDDSLYGVSAVGTESKFGIAQFGLSTFGTASSVPDVQPTLPPTAEIPDQAALVIGGTTGVRIAISSSETAVAASAAGSGPRDGINAGLGSANTIVTTIYRATRDNVWLEDISDRVEGGLITVDTTQATPMTLQARTTEPDVLTPYQDWIAPVVTMTQPDPLTGATITTRQQLGLYVMMPPVKTYSAAQGVQEIDARDPLWLLASSGPGEPWSRATGQNVGIAMETVCNLVGIRHAIQTTSLTLPKRRTWPWNATWLQIFNDLARSIGFVPAWVDRVGRVRSQRFKKLGNTTPARLISHTNGMVLETIRLEPDLTRLCNHVVVVGNDPKGTPVVAERLNDDPGSPTSTVSLGTKDEPVKITRFIEDPNLDDQDAVDALADRLIEQGTSVFQRVNMTTMPIVDWQIGDVAQLDIETDTGLPVTSGKHRWERMEMGLGLDATCKWTFLKLVNFAQVS